MTDNPLSTSIDTLIPRAKQGSEGALGTIFECYKGYLQLLAHIQISQRLRAKLAPSDVVQEAFIHVKEGISEFRGSNERELVVWLRRILARTLAEQVRFYEGTAKRSPQLEVRVVQDLDKSSRCLQNAFSDRISSPSERASRREEAARVADVLQRLPSHYREVIVLRSFEERSFPVVAEQMQRSVTSVKKLWTRALERFQQELNKHEYR